MRTFLYRDDSSNKFWHIEIHGDRFTVHYGRVGTRGQTQEKTFASGEEALKAANKLITEKLKKGYHETTAPTGEAALGHALEQAILDAPDDRAAHAAYSDWLQERNDPRGEVLQIHLALENPQLAAAERKRLQAREQELLEAGVWANDWAALCFKEGPEGRGQVDFPFTKPLEFVRGLPVRVTIDRLSAEAASAFNRWPEGRFVRELRIGGFDYEDDDAGRDILAAWPHMGNLRVFQLGWTSQEEYGDWCPFQCHLRGDFVSSWVVRMPRLEELYLFADGIDLANLFGLTHLENLRVLQVYHNWDYPLQTLAGNESVTNLTHLLLHPKALGSWSDLPAYITREGLESIAHSPYLQKLKHLRLRLTRFGDEGIRVLLESGLLARLESLDLRHGCVTDTGARLLAQSPASQGLRHLDLGHNALTATGIAALTRPGLSLNTADQHGEVPDSVNDEAEYLYQGDYE
jgi:uncharacterized protein (TIGR02996 family)